MMDEKRVNVIVEEGEHDRLLVGEAEGLADGTLFKGFFWQ